MTKKRSSEILADKTTKRNFFEKVRRKSGKLRNFSEKPPSRIPAYATAQGTSSQYTSHLTNATAQRMKDQSTLRGSYGAQKLDVTFAGKIQIFKIYKQYVVYITDLYNVLKAVGVDAFKCSALWVAAATLATLLLQGHSYQYLCNSIVGPGLHKRPRVCIVCSESVIQTMVHLTSIHSLIQKFLQCLFKSTTTQRRSLIQHGQKEQF